MSVFEFLIDFFTAAKELFLLCLELALGSDAVLLGAVGGPKWESLDYGVRPERALLGLREKLGLFANLRPVTVFDDLLEASPLKRDTVRGIDILIIRELTGDMRLVKSSIDWSSGRSMSALKTVSAAENIRPKKVETNFSVMR